MDRTTIASIFANSQALDGQQLTVAGWVRSLRDMKTFGFVTLNDGSCFNNLQVVMERESLANYDEISHQNVGAALIVRGTLVLTPDAPQPFELKAATIEVEGPSAPDYPLQKKRHTVEYLRTIQHLRPRTNLLGATFRVRSVAAYAIHKFFQERGFVYVNTPIITASDCEGRWRDVPRDHHRPGQPASRRGRRRRLEPGLLRQGGKPHRVGQLQAENFAMAFGNVYTFGPTFRAEDSNTQRHAAEFWMIEPEIAFADLVDDMNLAEEMLKYVITYVTQHCPDEMDFFNKFVDKGLKERLEHVATSDFGRVTYTEAIEILEKAVAEGHEFEYPVYWGRRPGHRARALPHRAAL